MIKLYYSTDPYLKYLYNQTNDRSDNYFYHDIVGQILEMMTSLASLVPQSRNGKSRLESKGSVDDISLDIISSMYTNKMI